jgi:thioredoxin reductase (NADPH)
VNVSEISAEKLQRIISERPSLSDLSLRTFIARQQFLRDSGYTGLLVIGSRFSRDSFRRRKSLKPYAGVCFSYRSTFAALLMKRT